MQVNVRILAKVLFLIFWAAGTAMTSGCGGGGAAAGRGSAADVASLLRVPPKVQSYRHSLLLGFERRTDELFVQASEGATRVSGEGPHTGRRCLEVTGSRVLEVKLSSLMSGRPFPADWTLLGAHLHVPRPVEVEASLVVDGETLLRKRQSLAGGEWSEVMLDLLPLSRGGAMSREDAAVLRFELSEPVMVRIDDVLLVDNRETLVSVADDWQIRREGHAYVVDQPRRFRIELKADLSQPDAWALAEASPLRVIFEQPDGGRRWVIYSDGRRYEDGVFKPTWSTEFNSDFAAQHAAPAQVSVPEEQGRLDRRSVGDANNDGYNERLGAYQIVAAGGRLDITLAPRTTQLVMPVLEIRGLPPGKLVVTVEGELIKAMHRAEGGPVLLVVPHKMGRPATVNVRVQ